MALPEVSVVARMQALIQQWEAVEDQRTVFLRCYQLMTRSILTAIEHHEFNDSAWVDSLLRRFANYYFVALEAYDQEPGAAPAVWEFAHNATRAPNVLALQKLLAGVNAHINYDLVLSLVDLLDPEWDSLSASERASRHEDHCHVNDVIGRTIDTVQDQIIEPAMPAMAILDEVLGPVDEMLVSRLITHWRETVWDNATRLLETRDPSKRARLIGEIEQTALGIANLIV